MFKFCIAVLVFLVSFSHAQAQLEFQLVSTDAEAMDNEGFPDQGLYHFRLEVSYILGENPLYIRMESTTEMFTTNPSGGLSFHMENPSNNAVVYEGTTAHLLTHISGGTLNGEYLKLELGDSAVIELTTYFIPDNSGWYQVQVDSVNTSFTESQANHVHYINPSVEYESPALYLQGTVPEPSVTVLGLLGFAGLALRRRR